MQLSVRIAEELILPTLRAIENDLYPRATEPNKISDLCPLRDLIEEMTVERSTDWSNHRTIDIRTAWIGYCAFHGRRDEIVGRVIARLLAAKGIGTDCYPGELFARRKWNVLKELKTSWILLSAIESRSVITVGRMAHSLSLRSPCFDPCRPLEPANPKVPRHGKKN